MRKISNYLKIKSEMVADSCDKCDGHGEYRHPHGGALHTCEACSGTGWADSRERRFIPAQQSPAVNVAFHPQTDELLTAKEFANNLAMQQSLAVAVPESRDREMLVTLMSAFDTEHTICAQCGNQEETMYMDSANMLRNYLAETSEITVFK